MIYITFTEESLKEFLIGKVIKDIIIDKTVPGKAWIKMTFSDGRTLDMYITHTLTWGEIEDAK